jgi:hypothetical protein
LRRWNRVRFNIFLCFFLRMRLRRFLISDPIRPETVAGPHRVVRTGNAVWLAGKGSNLQHPDSKSGVLPIELPAIGLMSRSDP